MHSKLRKVGPFLKSHLTKSSHRKLGESLETRLVPYSGKLSWEKTFVIRFRRLLAGTAKRCQAPKFRRETFANSHKTLKFVEVFSLEVSPLYIICMINCVLS